MAILAGLALVILSVGLIWSHFRTLRQPADPALFRRRLLTSGTLGLIGVAIIAGQFIVAVVQPVLFILFWLAVLLMAAALGLAGISDLILTRGVMRRRRELARNELQRHQSEVAAARERQDAHAPMGNGREHPAKQ